MTAEERYWVLVLQLHVLNVQAALGGVALSRAMLTEALLGWLP